jgi:hypothetical protein
MGEAGFKLRRIGIARIAGLLLGPFLLSGCAAMNDTIPAKIDRGAVLEYANYCVRAPDAQMSALSYARAGFAYVEQQCGIAFDKMTELTQFGRFSVKSLNAANLGASSIMQAAGVALQNVTIVSTAITFTEAAFNAFIEQYAFAPYLYKLRELTWQSFDAHRDLNAVSLAQLQSGFTPDDYCTAYILVQAHANVCTISNLQQLFDQQVANATTVVKPVDKAAGNALPPAAALMQNRRAATLLRAAQPRMLRDSSGRPAFAPLVSPNFTVH